MDTIFALATARGKAGVAIIRVSGPLAGAAGIDLAGSLPGPRIAATRTLTGPDGLTLDHALVLYFESGHSFTGEEVIEFHLHGSVATVRAVLVALGDMDGLRMANPGEFTRQALENGRLDLSQVEGLADLIESETESQRRQAMKTLSGALGKRATQWRAKLIRAAALLEATIDFVDEEVPVDVSPEVDALVADVAAELLLEEQGSFVAERIRDGFEVAIVGPPNVGKSTLLNVLAGREAAITSEIAGTTRDVIEVRMDLRGLAVTFLDTAGLRDTEDTVELIGVKRAVERATAADLRVFLGANVTTFSGLIVQEHDILVSGKVDTLTPGTPGVSGKTGQGVSDLVNQITDILEQRAAGAATAVGERHRNAIRRAIGALECAQSEIKFGPDRVELAAEELRRATRALDSLVGLVDVEHLLDEIFASFCVGK